MITILRHFYLLNVVRSMDGKGTNIILLRGRLLTIDRMWTFLINHARSDNIFKKMNVPITMTENRHKSKELIGETFKGFITSDLSTVWELTECRNIEIYSATEIE